MTVSLLVHNVVMSLDAVRDAIDSCGSMDTAVFARCARNAIAQAILAEALGHTEPRAPAHAPPPVLHDYVGVELGEQLVAVYAGGSDWTSHAIDALEPLNALARL
jgi:hypothetical protein